MNPMVGDSKFFNAGYLTTNKASFMISRFQLYICMRHSDLFLQIQPKDTKMKISNG